MIEEFKTFISRGNVIDLAVGVVVGGAFSKIVTSLVDNIIMPIVGILIGGIDFTRLSLPVFGVKIQFGLFLQNIVDFLIIALCIFLVIKLINKLTPKKEVKEEVKTPVKSDEVILLEEIRDLLKKEKKKTTK
ncbi:MAG: large-conductance mechanosensitive channel protein MscL [Bacilli bacterium]|nr:large-conductance mechanosensitive channel protein MscL [Bacilli bacterium]